jgi:hypothetical protein
LAEAVDFFVRRRGEQVRIYRQGGGGLHNEPPWASRTFERREQEAVPQRLLLDFSDDFSVGVLVLEE